MPADIVNTSCTGQWKFFFREQPKTRFSGHISVLLFYNNQPRPETMAVWLSFKCFFIDPGTEIGDEDPQKLKISFQKGTYLIIA